MQEISQLRKFMNTGVETEEVPKSGSNLDTVDQSRILHGM